MNATLMTLKFTSLGKDKKIEIEAKSADSADYMSISCEYDDLSIQQYSKEIHVRDMSISDQSSRRCGADKSVTDDVLEYLLNDLRVAFNMTEERLYTPLTTLEDTYDLRLNKENTAIRDHSFFKKTLKQQHNCEIHSTHKSVYGSHPAGGVAFDELSRHIRYVFLIGADYQSQLEKEHTQDRASVEIGNISDDHNCTVS